MERGRERVNRLPTCSQPLWEGAGPERAEPGVDRIQRDWGS